MPYWRLFYHFIWGTKHRLELIDPSFESILHGFITTKANDLGCLVHAVGGIEDHVHLLVSVPPKLALSSFIGQIKGSSSHFVNHRVRPGYEFAWQSEYGVLSISESQQRSVAHYVQRQREHHRLATLIPRFEALP